MFYLTEWWSLSSQNVGMFATNPFVAGLAGNIWLAEPISSSYAEYCQRSLVIIWYLLTFLFCHKTMDSALLKAFPMEISEQLTFNCWLGLLYVPSQWVMAAVKFPKFLQEYLAAFLWLHIAILLLDTKTDKTTTSSLPVLSLCPIRLQLEVRVREPPREWSNIFIF